MVGPKNEHVREILFWTCAALLGAAIVAIDRAALFVYFPRWTFILPTALFLFPTRVNSTYWARAGACVFLIALPFVLSPVRWNDLKSFYVACESLEQGMSFDDALARMSPHSKESMEGAAMYGVSESPEERSSRVVLIPSDEHSSDWCVLYPSGGRLARVEIRPD